MVICKIPFTFAQRELFDISKAQRIGAVVMSLNRYQQLLTSLLTSVTQIDTIFFIILCKDSYIYKKNVGFFFFFNDRFFRLGYRMLTGFVYSLAFCIFAAYEKRVL